MEKVFISKEVFDSFFSHLALSMEDSVADFESFTE